MKRYAWLAAEIAKLIAQGVLRPGDRIPSVRQASAQFDVSPGTVLQAYSMLEQEGFISPRPQSGYYVRSKSFERLPEMGSLEPPADAVDVDVSSVIYKIWGLDTQKSAIHFGSLFPDPGLLPLRDVNRLFGKYVQSVDPFIAAEAIPPGSLSLRQEIARRQLAHGCRVLPSEITLTEGSLDGMSLCLSAVAKPGEKVVTTSPCFPTQLLALERYGLKAVQIPVDPRHGPSLEKLEEALRRHRIAAVLLMANFHNPMGCTMTDERKQALVRILAERGIPLIEDDSNAELAFDGKPRRSAKSFDEDGGVLYFSTFSTWLALGYKVGWVSAGRYMPKVLALQHASSLGPSAYSQLAICRYLTHRPVKANLDKLRSALQSNLHAMSDIIGRHFPEGTAVSRPDGGYFLWVELPQGVDTLPLYRQVMEKHTSIVPGMAFCPVGSLRNFTRLNYGQVWDETVEASLREIGRLASKQLA